MKKEKNIFSIVLMAIGALLPGLAAGQQDSIRSFNLDEVVVTATKFPKNKNETGKVVTVIGSDILRQSVGKDLSQLLNEQAGLVINAYSNPGKDKSVYLRGQKASTPSF